MSFHQFFQDSSDRKCVTICLNGDYDGGKGLHVESEWNLHEFLNAASNRLGVASLKRIFNSDGVDIDDCMMIEDNDILFLSNGDEFIPPSASENIDLDSGSNGAERINGTISGFRIGKIIGRGGFGEVRVGEHHLTGEQVALKFLRKAEIISMGAAERTTTEIQCLSALRHQHIIRLQQQLETPHHVVLVLELMEGGDLFNFLYDRQVAAAGTDGPLPSAYNYALPEDEARHVFSQIISAVGYAHNQHICHRDLKLENILLKTKTLECVKIADFGLSAFYRPGALMKSSCGTLSFLAPEVFAGTSNAGPPLDVWAMGVILFALLCGRLPFEGPDLRGTKRPRDAVIQSRISKGQYKIEESLSPEAKDLVRRLLRVDPAVRSSVPEIFSHIWLRSAPGAVTFSTTKSVSTNLSSSGPTPSPITAHLQESDSNRVEIDELFLDDVQKMQGNTHGSMLDLMVASPAASSDLLSPGIERIDSGINLPRVASDRGTERTLSDRVIERCASEREWGSRDSDKGFRSDLSMSRSKSRSSCEDNEGGHDYEPKNFVANLENVSGEDIVAEDLEKVSLPTPSFDDEYHMDNPTADGLAMLNAENDTIDDLIPLPPPSPNRTGRYTVMGGSRENSFSTAGSRDVDDIDDKSGLNIGLISPRTSPPSASPFVLVPLRRKDVASEVIQSPRRQRSNTSGLDTEDIVRYQSSNDCFDYDSKPMTLPSGGANRNGRQSWTDHVDSQQDKDSHTGSGGGDDRSKPISSPSGLDSPRVKTGVGASSKFSSPTTSRNKLHMAGSLSLKSTTISSSAQKQPEGRMSTSLSPRERATMRTSRLHDTDNKISSPANKDRTNLRNSRFNSPAYTSSPDSHSRGGTVAPPAPNGRASTSHGRKVMRNPNGASGGHVI